MATKKERRIAILKDAIKQLKREAIIADPGTVLMIPDQYKEGDENADMQPILQKYFKSVKEKEQKCTACARGSLLLCTIHKENDFKMVDTDLCGGRMGEDDVTDKRLLRLFSKKQLALMENAFEVDISCKDLTLEELEEEDDWGYKPYDNVDYYGLNEDILPKKIARKSVEFGYRYKDAGKRLIAIFSNAVKNGGIFKP